MRGRVVMIGYNAFTVCPTPSHSVVRMAVLKAKRTPGPEAAAVDSGCRESAARGGTYTQGLHAAAAVIAAGRTVIVDSRESEWRMCLSSSEHELMQCITESPLAPAGQPPRTSGAGPPRLPYPLG
jgi:hypothetical protein